MHDFLINIASSFTGVRFNSKLINSSSFIFFPGAVVSTIYEKNGDGSYESEKGEKKIIVPYCTEDENGENKLGLWHMDSLEEMVVGKWNILEPPKELWGNPEKEVTPEELDMIMVPGVGFDRDGGRMGNGQGYYDRTMEKVRPDCFLIALCYESQLFDNILVAPHDVYMDKVVTEKEVYIGKGR